jgi:hypothetical protein
VVDVSKLGNYNMPVGGVIVVAKEVEGRIVIRHMKEDGELAEKRLVTRPVGKKGY